MEQTRQEKRRDGISLIRKYAPYFAAGFSFAIYLRTAAPTIFWGDGIELSAVCATAGIAHPTGYPLFTILGYIVCRFFPGNPALGTNLLCALFGSLASGFFFLTLRSVLNMTSPTWFLHPHYRDIVALAFALLLSFSRTFWFHATITEVYSLHLLFVILLLWIFFEYVQKGGTKRIVAFFGLWGLGFSNHMLTLTLAPLAVIMLCISIQRKVNWRVFPVLFAFFLLGLSFYLYLPLRAASRPDLNWGDPSNLKNFLWVISGGSFRNERFLMESPGTPFTLPRFGIFAVNRFLHFAFWMAEEIYLFKDHVFLLKSLVCIFLSGTALWGAVRILLLSKSSFAGLMGYLVFGWIMVVAYNIIDIEPYFLSIFPGLLILIMLGLLNILHIVEETFFERKINFLAYAFLLLPLMALGSHYRTQDKSQQTQACEYGLKILQKTPRRSMILTFSDNDIYILWYLQKALELRPDVTIVGANFIHSGWYGSYFENRPPDGPRLNIRQAASIPSKGDFYLDLMLDIINPNLDRFPILSTFTDPILEEFYQVDKVSNLFGESFYQKVPMSYLPHPYLYRISRKSKGEGSNG
jgi:hypothetical protein